MKPAFAPLYKFIKSPVVQIIQAADCQKKTQTQQKSKFKRHVPNRPLKNKDHGNIYWQLIICP